MEDLFKAYNEKGEQGKFRRIDGGKVKFIRSKDGVVEKEATSTAHHDADLGSPAAEVVGADGMKRKKVEKCDCSLLVKCASCSPVKKATPPVHPICKGCGMPAPLCKCGAEVVKASEGMCEECGESPELCKCGNVEKSEDTCDCSHEGLCKQDVDCPCDCTDRATCKHRADKVEKDDSEVCKECGK